MPTVIGYHDVKDTDHWLASPKREEFFGPLGVTNIRTFEATAAMAHDAVVPKSLVILVSGSRFRPRGSEQPTDEQTDM